MFRVLRACSTVRAAVRPAVAQPAVAPAAVQPARRPLVSAAPAARWSRGYTSRPRRLNSDEEIDAAVAAETWSLESLLPHLDPEEMHKDINPALLRSLLKQGGLEYPTSAEDEQSMIMDLRRQAVFVDHVQDCDASAYEPLVRLGADPEPLVFDELLDEPGEAESWQPAALAARREGPYYVLDERVDGGADK
ncbi:uncharacterized protein V1510DRAFT_414410 [Dipodascopsis tothii]|uniref:uncharacterized protein n=1 Tax=Dipodascopsis tothii TaxID=44089 RepID=UPI0034CEB176